MVQRLLRRAVRRHRRDEKRGGNRVDLERRRSRLLHQSQKGPAQKAQVQEEPGHGHQGRDCGVQVKEEVGGLHEHAELGQEPRFEQRRKRG